MNNEGFIMSDICLFEGGFNLLPLQAGVNENNRMVA